MYKKIDLLKGNITTNLFKLSLPIILTSLISILYNLTDMKFISYYLGDEALAATASATFFFVFAFALLIVPKNGAQICVAQSIGAKIYRNARAYARISLILTFIFSIICTIIGLLFSETLIKIVGISKMELLIPAISFLKVCSLGIPFFFLTTTISAIISADGDTFGPFVFNSIGVATNIFLDYLFLGVFRWGISGAATATVIAQILSFILIVIYFKSPKSKFRKMKIFKLDNFNFYLKLIKIGLPGGISQALMTLIGVLLANLISSFDENVLAVQRLGIHFESLSWNISAGLSSAVATYIAQNYGAKKYHRIEKIYYTAIKTITIFAMFITIIFLVFADTLFRAFLEDEYLIRQGVLYIRIIGITQIFQCIEIITNGAFNGIGKINQPTIISIVGTVARVPLAYLLAPIFGLISIWWIISTSMFIKGIISLIWFLIIWKKFLREVNIYENCNR